MPTKTPENFIKDLRHVALTASEALTMRERLVAYSDLHAVPAESAVGSKVSVLSFFYSYPRVAAGSALALILLVSGTGISYAAEGTLPGQILYPVKVAIVEPMQGALITSTEGQAEWQDQLASRRLAEAATLASEHKLATTTQAYLEQSAAQHVALAQQDATELADSGNESAALTVQSDLAINLSTHAAFLASITPTNATTATTTGVVIALVQDAEHDHMQVQSLRAAQKADYASTTILAVASNDSTGDAMEGTSTEGTSMHAVALFKLAPGMLVPTTTSTTTSSLLKMLFKHNRIPAVEASSTADLPINALSVPSQ
jgi:hypothetical protein